MPARAGAPIAPYTDGTFRGEREALPIPAMPSGQDTVIFIKQYRCRFGSSGAAMALKAACSRKK